MKGSTPIPHDPGTLIPDALERAFARMSSTAQQNTKFAIGEFSFIQKPRATLIRVYLQRGYDRRSYIGQVTNHRFAPIATLAATDREAILTILKDPKRAAIEHGKSTGCCACCGRDLTDPASLLLGIGPICLGNFGWDDEAISLEDMGL